MGMGLYIVKRVVKSFDGRIRLVPAPDGFATAMEVRMPNA
jgi:signal transduction histidine kinase